MREPSRSQDGLHRLGVETSCAGLLAQCFGCFGRIQRRPCWSRLEVNDVVLRHVSDTGIGAAAGAADYAVVSNLPGGRLL
jgi:hypothetical protein